MTLDVLAGSCGLPWCIQKAYNRIPDVYSDLGRVGIGL